MSNDDWFAFPPTVVVRLLRLVVRVSTEAWVALDAILALKAVRSDCSAFAFTVVVRVPTVVDRVSNDDWFAFPPTVAVKVSKDV